MQLEHVRGEIERMRLQVHRQRGDIRKLEQAGIWTASAEALLDARPDRQALRRAGPTQERAAACEGHTTALGGRSW
jgi:hypothetical protein